MHLYKIEADDSDTVHVVARSDRQAADVFVTWRAANTHAPDSFTIECVPINSLRAQQQAQVRSAFALGLVGVARLDEETGWTFSATLWPPLDADHSAGEASDGASS